MSKDIKEALKHCIEWNCIDCPNREELGSGETVCRGRLLPEVLEYVADLEAKIDFLRNGIIDDETLKSLIKEHQMYKDIEAKLAEKEKELHYKIAECEKWKTDYVNCSKLEKIMSKEHQYCLDNWRASEQYKINFAIEQLEKVKEKIQEDRERLIQYSDISGSIMVDAFLCDCKNYIDNQIEELKKEMK